ncbi:MAG: TerB family tellurite resistance protein [Planctomycetota bacterium]|nr:TerB family tellurite resistance protein [Planctomycetota bacterium]
MLYFIIVWGSRGINKTLAIGQFYCPQCEGEEGYKHIRVRNFFTLYFIPIIPMGTLGEYIECQHCQFTYKKAILCYDPDAEREKALAEFEIAITRVMVMVMLADGVIEDSELEVIQRIYLQLTERELSREELGEYIEDLERVNLNDPRERRRLLRKMLGSLNTNGCEMVVKAAFMVAAADGEILQGEQDMLEQIGVTLGIKIARVRQMIGDFDGQPLSLPDASGKKAL